MLLFFQSLFGCLLFTAVLIPAARNPLRYISMYPEGVEKAVRKLPKYTNQSFIKRGRLVSMLVQGIIFVVVGIILCLFAGKITFITAFRHMLIFFMIINLYDLLVIDYIFFIRLRVFRIPGTEDMDYVYKDYYYHFKVFIRGLVLGLVISIITGIIVWMLK